MKDFASMMQLDEVSGDSENNGFPSFSQQDVGMSASKGRITHYYPHIEIWSFMIYELNFIHIPIKSRHQKSQ